MTVEKVLVSAADITRVQPLSEAYAAIIARLSVLD